jgi:hypothetical protein
MGWSGSLGVLFDDVHFYLICWARLGKLAQYIGQATQFRRVGFVRRRYHREMEDMTRARDHLEHFEERLPGGPKSRGLRKPHDLFNIVGDQMTFGGDQFDVGPHSLDLLTNFVAELRDAILFESIEVLTRSDPQLLKRRIRDAQQETDMNRAIRRVTASLQRTNRGR